MGGVSPLESLQQACQDLQMGDAKAAIVAGINLVPSENSSQTADAREDCAFTGEAVSVMFIKPLHDAVRNGDPIRAVIRATSTTHEAKSEINMIAQRQALERLVGKTYESAGLDPRNTSFVEVSMLSFLFITFMISARDAVQRHGFDSVCPTSPPSQHLS